MNVTSDSKIKVLRLGIIERFVLVVGFLVLSLVLTEMPIAPLLTLVLFFLLKIEKLSWRSIFYFLRIPLAFVVVGLLSIILVLSASEPNTVLLISRKYIPLSITIESLKMGEVVLWRAINALLSLYLLIATTTPKEKNQLAIKLNLPQEIIELGILSFRYIQLLDTKKQQIQLAQRLRLGYTSYRKSFQSTVLLLSTVFIYSASAFRLNHQALLSRGYNGRLYYASDDDFPTDRWWLILTVLVVVALLIFMYKCYF